MGEKNLWGELPSSAEMRTPYFILCEQAAMLGQLTDHLLVAEVTQDISTEHDFLLELNIVAPSLNNYSYRALWASHDAEIYPVTVETSTNVFPIYDGGLRKKCRNEEVFVEAVGKILSCDKVRKVIAGLLSEIKQSHTRRPDKEEEDKNP
jgi:hypothetical protein